MCVRPIFLNQLVLTASTQLSIIAVRNQAPHINVDSAHVVQVSVGLAASIALLLLSLLSSLFAAKENSALPIAGTGILHAIWLYRNHPELETLLKQVDHPTNDNLRDAGMVRTRLVQTNIGKPRRRSL